MELPIEWGKYYERRAYFVTYYGDIYPGHIYDFREFPGRYFIIPQIHRKELQELQRTGITIERLNKLGWEIKDPKGISRIIEDEQLGSDDNLAEEPIHGNQEWKKMFVFGAGASAFCVPKSEMSAFGDLVFWPPLGDELFNNRFRNIFEHYKGVKLSLARLLQFNNEVERYLQSEWHDIRDTYNPDLLSRHIDIIYYLQEIFFNVSNEAINNLYSCNLYSAFTDILQKNLSKNTNEKVAFVNFNYDTILDYYVSSHFNVDFHSIDDYIRHNSQPFLYFKPHGSHNWGWRFQNEIIEKVGNNVPQWLFDNKISLDEIYYKHLGSVHEMVHRHGWNLENEKKFSINKNLIQVIRDRTRDYFPAILIPYRDKDEFVMPYPHLSKMKQFASKMEELFLIGWKGNESAFNSLLRDNIRQLKKIIIVNPNPIEVEKNLSVYLGELREKYEVISFPTFEEFVKSELL